MRIKNYILLTGYFLSQLFMFSCSGDQKEKKLREDPRPNKKSWLENQPTLKKDTLTITEITAVFYHPDSLQLDKIKKQTDPNVFDGTAHEYFYLMRNARMVIQKNWKDLKIIEAKNYRYLFFKQKDGNGNCIDLNTLKEPYGLYVFNRVKPPLLLDMSNIETQISFYLLP